jgi:hypothetical protein
MSSFFKFKISFPSSAPLFRKEPCLGIAAALDGLGEARLEVRNLIPEFLPHQKWGIQPG